MGIIQSEEGIEFINSSSDFKEGVTQKFLSRGNRTANHVAEETGVTVKTLYNWAEQYAKDTPMRKKNRTTFEKMKLVIEFDSLNDENRGEFLRRYGLYEADIKTWRESVLAGKIEKTTENMVRKQLEKNNKELKRTQKELMRKDKALAEAAALLILKKKVDGLFGEDEE